MFGNLSHLLDSEWEPVYYHFIGYLIQLEDEINWHLVKKSYMSDPIPIGNKFSLFGHSRNNLAKTSVSLATKHGVRLDIPSKAMVCFITLAKCYTDKYW